MNFFNPVHPGSTPTTATSPVWLGLPFDLAREQYALAVKLGLLRRSMIDWARFERGLGKLEQLMLGPWARSV